MGVEVLPDVSAQLLRTLGLKEGDILRVMKTLDGKFGRTGAGAGGAPLSPGLNRQEDEDRITPVNGSGGLFSGKDGALRNNTRKGRPAPPVQTRDVVDDAAFRPPAAQAQPKAATPLAGAPARQPTSGSGAGAGVGGKGFEDDAWDVKPARTAAMAAAQGQRFEAGGVEPPPGPPPGQQHVQPPQQVSRGNDDLSLLALPLQPMPTGAAAPPPTPAPSAQAPPQQQPQQQQQQQPQAPPPAQQGADQALFDKIAALAPPRQRPMAPPAVAQLQQSGGAGGLAPPPRAASAPGFNPNPHPQAQALQAQSTGYAPQQQGMYGQPTGMGMGLYAQPTGMPPLPMQGGFMAPQPAQQQQGVQAMQQNFPALQPQPTGMAFAPQSQFGQQAAGQQYLGPQQGQPTGFPQQQQQQQQQTGFQQQQASGFQQAQASGFQQTQPTGFAQQGFPPTQGYQQVMVSGAQTGSSPFADPPRLPFQPVMASGSANSFAPQQTGFQPQPTGFQPQQQQQQQQQQPGFSMPQPTGLNNGYQQQQQYAHPPIPPMPQLPPQQTGGVFGPSQPLAGTTTPLVPQKTGPPPPVRFGVSPAAQALMPQPTGRANLGRATPQNPFGF
ncbi:cytoskeletal protein binding protein [Teratosphaeriaceae sp. CCFEE 6253]|nr:cytoskeletal protein binding protein [Teratosphaeriaceae sp. CCFEE 6253]